MRTPLVAGNWKMHGTLAESSLRSPRSVAAAAAAAASM